jgi:hypothetical protein
MGSVLLKTMGLPRNTTGDFSNTTRFVGLSLINLSTFSRFTSHAVSVSAAITKAVRVMRLNVPVLPRGARCVAASVTRRARTGG